MLPEKFKSRMKKLLGEQYARFLECFEGGESVRGVRLNPKLDYPEETVKDFGLLKLPYVDNGYIFPSSESVGALPEHHSGAFYMQDPAAMSALGALDIDPQWWVCDLCAAPGGKATGVGERLDGGFLLANEYVKKRAHTLVGNIERLGIKNATVTSLDVSELCKFFDSAFDLCLLDVPCSGEGMFRKSDEALTEWSEENVRICAARSAELIENAAGLVRGGGYLLYSTCTYSLEENEMIIDAFLTRHPEFELVPVKDELSRVTADGICFEGAAHSSLSLTRRFYPHVFPGEGQFIALMKKSEKSVKMTSILYKDVSKAPMRDELDAVNTFFKEALTKAPDGKVRKVGDNLVLISHSCPVLPYSVFSAGVLLGELKGRTFTPSHHFYKAYGALFKSRGELSGDGELIAKYLSGEQIPNKWGLARGFVALTYRGLVLGGGKCNGDFINNHYPKGLRNK
ncbi:MAG: hypothetical protein IIX96_02250 [Clostridia bacterium]|nr:hypothetical protein [Clostridia bacterium]